MPDLSSDGWARAGEREVDDMERMVRGSRTLTPLERDQLLSKMSVLREMLARARSRPMFLQQGRTP